MTQKSSSANGIRNGPIALVVSILFTLVMYYGPTPDFIYRPLILLSTLAHELGHGLSAALIGAEFDSFQIYKDGSGVAIWKGSVGNLGRAFISAGGLVGPAVVAGILFAAARRPLSAKLMLWFFSAALTILLILVVRNLFGIGFVACVAFITAIVATKGSEGFCQWYCSFIGAQLGLSVFSRADYLFTDVAQTELGPMPSDVAQISEALFFPYWFWGGCCGLLSVAILLFGLIVAFRE